MAQVAIAHDCLSTLPDGGQVVSLPPRMIWDGADLALIRECLRHFVRQGARDIGVDVTAVKTLPPGFFGALYDYYEAGLRVRLFNPTEELQQLLWFRGFFQQTILGEYEMRRNQELLATVGTQPHHV